MIRRCLIANRGEIAIRIARSCADLGIESVAVHGADDADALHVARADRRVALPGRGARAYLDVAAVLEAARAEACDAVHPGYGFLAENAGFATAVEAAGLAWVGPTPAQLELFGDKIAARALARRCEVPVLEGSQAVTTREEVDAFVATLGAGGIAVIKAAAGGGGRGMQVLLPEVDVATALARCADEARAAFGDGTLYAERFVAAARHVEVQVIGDGRGAVTHLWERDCSLQRRHQKLVEIAPAPALPAALRTRLLDCACRMAAAVDYRGLGTFEFLVDVAADACWFIEANPRLQVEHTVTEEVLGLDLVALQFAIAAGRRLADLGLAAPPPAPRDAAIQLRVNTETLGADGVARAAGGIIARYEAPGGPGVRVDGAAYAGYAPNASFDPMIAKIVVRASGLDFATLARRAERAAAECRIDGVDTNLPLLRALLRHPEVQAARLTTRFVEREAAALQAAAAALAPAPALAAASTQIARSARAAPPGAAAIGAPMRGSVVSIDVELGQSVARGAALAVLEAMKMHHLI
ncbi:MAG: biotin carboxylase N-terminal domain-containing protein [Gammaproteobacteria bacterium]